jgi:hypothetical protein
MESSISRMVIDADRRHLPQRGAGDLKLEAAVGSAVGTMPEWEGHTEILGRWHTRVEREDPVEKPLLKLLGPADSPAKGSTVKLNWHRRNNGQRGGRTAGKVNFLSFSKPSNLKLWQAPAGTGQ